MVINLRHCFFSEWRNTKMDILESTNTCLPFYRLSCAVWCMLPVPRPYPAWGRPCKRQGPSGRRMLTPFLADQALHSASDTWPCPGREHQSRSRRSHHTINGILYTFILIILMSIPFKSLCHWERVPWQPWSPRDLQSRVSRAFLGRSLRHYSATEQKWIFY